MDVNGPSLVTLVTYLAVALLLSSAIGLEREYRQKSAGLRTNALVGLGAALFMIISKYGFFDMMMPGVSLDPSRVAAQIVTGIGFIGGGIIFVKRNDVRGLTTAAGVWLTAAIGTAAGAGLLLIATIATGAYYIVAFAYPFVIGAMRRTRPVPWLLHLQYMDGRGVLRAALTEASRQGFEIGEVTVSREDPVVQWAAEGENRSGTAPVQALHRQVSVVLELEGKSSAADLTESLGQIDGVVSVRAEDVREEFR